LSSISNSAKSPKNLSSVLKKIVREKGTISS
jgi:hypothetical protein